MRYFLLGLVICSVAVGQEAEAPSAQKRYDALIKEYNEAEKAWIASLDGDQSSRREWPGTAFAPRFLALAESAPDDPAATAALLWVVDRAMNVGAGDRQFYPSYRKAVERLCQGRHLDDPRVGKTCGRGLRYASPPAKTLLRLMIERSRNRDNRGRATLTLGKILVQEAEIARLPWLRGKKTDEQEAHLKRLAPEFLAYLLKIDPEPCEREAEALFERAIEEYENVEYRPPTGEGDRGETVADAARSALHELRDLALGRPAPEIEGEDVDGHQMKLSDFRGKIVVLTFWATWCGPCMAQIPHERSLVERMRDEPFVLLGVNGDRDREHVKKVIGEEQIAWRSFWNGGPFGPITDLYSVEGWPTVYVLDAHGTIRYKQVIEAELDQAVDALLKEMKTARP